VKHSLNILSYVFTVDVRSVGVRIRRLTGHWDV